MPHKTKVDLYHSTRLLFWIVIFCFNFCSPFQLDHHIIRRETTKRCTTDQFSCKSRECIDISNVCDGTKNCKDGSDETETRCKDNGCPSLFFKCKYGACIDADLKCNGRQDCADNSDETDNDCPKGSSNAGSTKKCGRGEWKCKTSKKCILKEDRCDGKVDCEDGSDERKDECGDIPCPAFNFQCNYGACINITSKCNGIKECADGSDENVNVCNDIFSTSQSSLGVRIPNSNSDPPRDGFCTLPNGPVETNYTIGTAGETWFSTPYKSKLPKYSQIKVTCKPGYDLPSAEKVQKSFCWEKEAWTPPLIPCQKTCEKLKSENMDLDCFYRGHQVACENEPINGTTVRPQCKSYFRQEYPAYYRYLECGENGEWDHQLFKCVPECGVSNIMPQLLISYGQEAVLADSPWHVALYKLTDAGDGVRGVTYPALICGGTIVTKKIVLSAAHCFFSSKRKALVNETTNYEIVVGKQTKSYTAENDTVYQRKYKISELIFTYKSYDPPKTGHYGEDIVVIVLQEDIEMSQFVQPACVDWQANSRSGFQPDAGARGKLVGWGVNRNASQLSEKLLFAELPFISYQDCKGKVIHLSPDKFCAGSESGPGAERGDSGGGLLFSQKDGTTMRNYIRGIVSTKNNEGNSSIATFTDIAVHMEWLYEIRKRVERG